jgi:hypothetical protein
MNEMRRLSDKIIAAHSQACDEKKMDVANLLLQALEVDVSAIGGENEEHREATEGLEQAFLKHETTTNN